MRLLNVAVTRARDKLLLVANIRHIRQEPSSSLCRRLYSWPVLATYYIRSKPRHKVYIIRTYFLRASQKSPSRSKQPSKRHVGVRGEAPDLPSDVRHLMGIHQGEHHGVQDREHLGYRRKVNPTAILSQGDITPKVGADFQRYNHKRQVRHEVARCERGKSLQASVHACPQSFSASLATVRWKARGNV